MTGSILHNRKEVLFTTLWDTFHSIVYFNLYSIFNSSKLMTYLFWSPTKTINFLKIWLMILNLLVLMLKVSVLTFPLKVMVFSQISLPSWQVQSVKYEHSLTMLLHCPCLCCHSCFWVNGCVRRYSLLFVYICIAHYQKGLDLRSHLQVKPTIFRVYIVLFSVQWYEVTVRGGFLSLRWCWLNCWQLLFNGFFS